MKIAKFHNIQRLCFLTVAWSYLPNGVRYPLGVERGFALETGFRESRKHAQKRGAYPKSGARCVRRNPTEKSFFLLGIEFFAQHAKQDIIIILAIAENHSPLPSFLEET